MTEAVIYTTTYCTYCQAAKKLLTKKKISYREIGLDNDPELRQKISAANNGWRTVPMIFIDDRFIGGYTELVSCLQKKETSS